MSQNPGNLRKTSSKLFWMTFQFIFPKFSSSCFSRVCFAHDFGVFFLMICAYFGPSSARKLEKNATSWMPSLEKAWRALKVALVWRTSREADSLQVKPAGPIRTQGVRESQKVSIYFILSSLSWILQTHVNSLYPMPLAILSHLLTYDMCHHFCTVFGLNF